MNAFNNAEKVQGGPPPTPKQALISGVRDATTAAVTRRHPPVEHTTSQKRLETVQKIAEQGKLADNMQQHQIETPDGTWLIDIVVSTYAGYGYKPDNEDVCGVHIDYKTGKIQVVVGDAMGGGANGVQVAAIAKKALQQYPHAPKKAIAAIYDALRRGKMDPQRDGLCLLSADIQVGKTINVVQAGDVELHHFSSKGDYKFKPTDYLKEKTPFGEYLQSQSFLDSFQSPEYLTRSVDEKLRMNQALKIKLGLTDAFIAELDRRVRAKEPLVKGEDRAFYKAIRKMTGNAITAGNLNSIDYETGATVQAGDVIYVLSDGASDNFTQTELQNITRYITSKELSSEAATRLISDELDKRMRMADEIQKFEAGGTDLLSANLLGRLGYDETAIRRYREGGPLTNEQNQVLLAKIIASPIYLYKKDNASVAVIVIRENQVQKKDEAA